MKLTRTVTEVVEIDLRRVPTKDWPVEAIDLAKKIVMQRFSYLITIPVEERKLVLIDLMEREEAAKQELMSLLEG